MNPVSLQNTSNGQMAFEYRNPSNPVALAASNDGRSEDEMACATQQHCPERMGSALADPVTFFMEPVVPPGSTQVQRKHRLILDAAQSPQQQLSLRTIANLSRSRAELEAAHMDFKAVIFKNASPAYVEKISQGDAMWMRFVQEGTKAPLTEQELDLCIRSLSVGVMCYHMSVLRNPNNGLKEGGKWLLDNPEELDRLIMKIMDQVEVDILRKIGVESKEEITKKWHRIFFLAGYELIFCAANPTTWEEMKIELEDLDGLSQVSSDQVALTDIYRTVLQELQAENPGRIVKQKELWDRVRLRVNQRVFDTLQDELQEEQHCAEARSHARTRCLQRQQVDVFLESAAAACASPSPEKAVRRDETVLCSPPRISKREWANDPNVQVVRQPLASLQGRVKEDREIQVIQSFIDQPPQQEVRGAYHVLRWIELKNIEGVLSFQDRPPFYKTLTEKELAETIRAHFHPGLFSIFEKMTGPLIDRYFVKTPGKTAGEWSFSAAAQVGKETGRLTVGVNARPGRSCATLFHAFFHSNHQQHREKVKEEEKMSDRGKKQTSHTQAVVRHEDMIRAVRASSPVPGTPGELCLRFRYRHPNIDALGEWDVFVRPIAK